VCDIQIKSRSMASGHFEAQTSSQDDLRRYELMRDLLQTGRVKDSQLTYAELCDYVQTRVREIGQFEGYTLLEEEKKSIEMLFNSVDKNKDGLVQVYSHNTDPSSQELVKGYVEYLAFSTARQRELQRSIFDLSSEIETLATARADAVVMLHVISSA
jgi:hypothetical protein